MGMVGDKDKAQSVSISGKFRALSAKHPISPLPF
jgi:hypothetical protein